MRRERLSTIFILRDLIILITFRAGDYLPDGKVTSFPACLFYLDGFLCKNKTGELTSTFAPGLVIQKK
jgi:hypothetical protein